MACLDLKSPVTLRLVTNLLLMISDLDVLFSTLFIYSLYELSATDWRYGFFMGVVLATILTYFLGALWFAPRQKLKVMKIVKQNMAQIPNEFVSPIPAHRSKGPVNMESSIDPSKRARTFKQCTESGMEDMDGFQQGLVNWGLFHMWSAAEIKNARNCCERKHSVPFYRLARLGFMADPTPKDLSCILNCNALYSFTTGVVQIVFGCIMMYDEGFIFQVIVPLSISGFSLVLSMANILLNFSALCMSIDAEQRVADRVQQGSAGRLEEGKQKLTKTRDAEIDKIEKEFEGKTDAPSLVGKKQRMDTVNRQFELDLQNHNEDNLQVLEIELQDYRHRLKRIQEIMKGKGRVQAKQSTTLETFNDAMSALREKEEKINVDRNEKLRLVDDSLPAAAYQAEMERINNDANTKLNILKEQMRQMGEHYGSS